MRLSMMRAGTLAACAAMHVAVANANANANAQEAASTDAKQPDYVNEPLPPSGDEPGAPTAVEPASADAETKSEVGPNAGSQVEEVIVTAQKRSQSVQDIPATIDAIGAEDLKDRQLSSLADLQSQIPGLKFDPVGGSSNITVRGIGTTFTTGAGENSVALHEDGVYLSSARAAAMGQFDLQRVEVLSGPQSTLYGKNSTAGVVNFISATPTSEFEAGTTFGLGNYSDKKAQAYVGGPIGDRVRARLYGDAESRDGYTKNLTTGQGLDDLKAYGGRLSIDADITPFWLMEARVTARTEHFAGPAFQPFDPSSPPLPSPDIDYTPRELNTDVIYDSKRDLELASIRNTFDLGDNLSLVSLTGASHFHMHQIYENLAEPPFSVPGDTPITFKTASQEFNLKGDSDKLQWLLGSFVYYESSHVSSTIVLPAALVGSPTDINNRGLESATRVSASGFGDATWRISDATRVFGGARLLHEYMRNNLTNSLDTEGTTVATVCTPGNPEQVYNDWATTGRVGVQHDVTEQAMTYAQLSRGYKAGGFSNNACGNEYKPEKVNAAELGVKSRWLDRALTLNASAYYYDYKNLSIEQSSLAQTAIVNAPKSHVLGLDLQGRWRLTQTWGVDGNATFLKSAYDEFISSGGAALGTPDGTSLEGRALNKAPSAAGSLGTDLKWAAGQGGFVSMRGETVLSSPYRLREYDGSASRQAGYALYNAYAIYSPIEPFTVRAYVRNISNTDYVVGTIVFLQGAVAAFNQPRTYGVEFAYTFH
ncbi:MAG: hypothetical protein JWQ90_4746 [Hydrocarboniphaga sp.]|uniref:TonB-dependent receptor n=1 Tax=Hydrocarboniphaga sp. TaxID=2033016 RepID=UPI0026114C2C|nr:TonB-dependent receptor [Hydrocarboniphaga sp.]MDB5972296.1 hypothetical protein [Hydrocarboniphaga sp.]